ncbi:MAG TPA: hypothetical protein VIJ22_01355, partial [Polyangiaceae bacterium]
MLPAHLTRTFAPTLLAALVAGVACHSSSKSPAASGATGVVARFDTTTNATPNFLDVPFPSDVYLQGGQVMTIPGMDAV